jgi:uncharacterized protein (TIGR02246 family)
MKVASRFLVWSWVVVGWSTLAAADEKVEAATKAQSAEKSVAAKPADAAKDNSPEEGVREAVALYASAFNLHDAEALAARWSEQGVHVDQDTGERTSGRDAIQKDFAKLFADNAELTLGVRVDTIRFIRPDVAQITGQAVTVSGDEEPNDSTFTAIVVKSGEDWLLDSVNETVIPAPPKPSDYLQELEFFVGHWVDESDEVRVDTTVRWGANRSFLVRSYTLDRGDGVEHQGTQVIGWDPKNERIRCWMFDSDGSFGEGSWSQTEDGWSVKLSRTLADGRSAGGTQVITKIDNDTLSVQTIGMEVDGEASPSTDPVRVVRVVDEAVE